MAAHHFRCRPVASANPDIHAGDNAGARRARFKGRCATCGQRFPSGEPVSFSRDRDGAAPSPAGLPPGAVPISDAGVEGEEHEETAEDKAPASALSPAVKALADELVPYLEGRLRSAATLDRSEVEKIVREVAAPRATSFSVTLPSGEVKDAGVQHKQFPVLVKALAAGCNVWVTGPAGSGKTTAIHNAAKALGIDYRYTGACQDQYALTGYCDANGRYVRTPCRDAYEHGGLFLWDEVDASDPNALLAFNAMLANGTASFPDGMIARHEKTLLAATANTFGLGADSDYVGRNRLDAAFLDRWVAIKWQVDEDLEQATCSNPAWVKRVQEVRRRVAQRGLKVLITPRASYAGARLLAAGLDVSDVEAMTLRKAMTDEQWKAVA